MTTPSPRLRLYSDRQYLPDGETHATILSPFWGKPESEQNTLHIRRFDNFLKISASLFEMTSLGDADLAVLPFDWPTEGPALATALRFAEHATHAHKRLLAFNWEDECVPVDVEGAAVFRTSFHRSTRKPGDFSVPYWFEDFVEEYLGGQVSIRQKQDKPVVGFCGFADPLEPSLKDRLRGAVRQVEAVVKGRTGHKAMGTLGRAIRTQALRVLNNSPKVATNFVVRDRFWAGAAPGSGGNSLEARRKVRQEYVQNIVDSDYVLCARGAANASYRLYETLCCGRIPVFIDTDSPLPYDFAVDWKRYCVWVDQSEIERVGDKVAEFHNKLSPAEFMEFQRECRHFWQSWLSPEGFFTNFYRHFSEN